MTYNIIRRTAAFKPKVQDRVINSKQTICGRSVYYIGCELKFDIVDTSMCALECVFGQKLLALLSGVSMTINVTVITDYHRRAHGGKYCVIHRCLLLRRTSRPKNFHACARRPSRSTMGQSRCFIIPVYLRKLKFFFWDLFKRNTFSATIQITVESL